MLWLLSILLASAFVLAWPDLFLFSKVVYLPTWVRFFPDPWVASWLLMLPPFSLALPGNARFKSAAARLLSLAFVGPTCGVIVQSVLWRLDGPNPAAQAIWVFVTCSLPPTIVLLLVIAFRSRRAAPSSPTPESIHGSA